LSAADLFVQALRCIKNCVIGNRRQKQYYIHLDAVKLLVAVLASPTADAAQLVQAAAAVGSFAASKEGLLSVIHHRGLLHLLKVLQSSEDVKVVEAAVRAVKSVCRVRRRLYTLARPTTPCLIAVHMLVEVEELSCHATL
jgi:hypothetical protein